MTIMQKIAPLAAAAALAAPASALDPIGPGAWTLVLLPDTQTYTSAHPEMFDAQTRWIAANKNARNIRFVLHKGDVTDNNNDAQWTVARDAMKRLVDAKIPFAIAPGNHDFGPNGGTATRDTLLNTYFSPKDYRHSREVGYFEAGKLDNSWHAFRVGETDYLVLALEFGPRDAIVEWADSVVANHPRHTAILVTHAFIYSDETRYDVASRGRSQIWNPHHYPIGPSPEGVNDGEDLWRKLIAHHANIRFVFNGHVLHDGAGHVLSFNNAGHAVHQMLANYQGGVETRGVTRGGDAYLRLLEFPPDGRSVKVTTYSPALDREMTDADHRFTVSTASESYRRVAAANLAVSGSQKSGDLRVSVASGDPNLTVSEFANREVVSPNDGDYQVAVGGLGASHRNGVLLATVRQNGRDERGSPRYASVEVDRNKFGNHRAAIAVSQAGTGGAAEMNADVAVAWFPFAGGWRAAHVNADGTIETANGIFASDVSREAPGRFRVTLPAANSETDGMLFVLGNNNENRVASSAILPEGRGWSVALRENRHDARDAAEGSVSLLYIPYNADNLIGGRVAPDGALRHMAGQPEVRREAAGVYRIRIPGQSPSTGMLILTVAGEGVAENLPDDNILSYAADGEHFVVHSRDLPGLALEDTGFVFAFIAFDKSPSLKQPYLSPFPR